MIWGQDRDQLLRGGMPDVRGPILLRVGLPRRRRAIFAVINSEAIVMRLARGHVSRIWPSNWRRPAENIRILF